MTGESRIRKAGACLAILLILQLIAGSVEAREKRIALVVGIANYETIPSLKNTLNDSELIARTLESLSFEVTKLTNAGLEQFRGTINDFAFRSETADVALVYFAGHGMEVGGQNLLIPADSTAKNRREAAATSVSLKEILAAVDRARQLRIVILNSCRDDPFREEGEQQVTVTVSGNRSIGMAPPSPERGTLVAYAAKDGAVALDGEGENSPFALALSQNLSAPNIEIGLMFRQVRDAVLRETRNQQEPHTYGSLSGDPYFLAGSNQQVNALRKSERRRAWTNLDVDQVEQIEKLASEGDTRSLKALASMRLNSLDKLYDPAKAAQLFAQAAEAGDPGAQFELAQLYERGIGVDQDVAKALELYEQSASADFADALNDLGFLNFNGAMGLAPNKKRALDFFEKAADRRHPPAMYNFAAMIDEGLVTGKTPQDAAGYLYGALRGGEEQALTELTTKPKLFNRPTRMALQRVLAENGFYDGTIDGQFGPQTSRAMRLAFGYEE